MRAVTIVAVVQGMVTTGVVGWLAASGYFGARVASPVVARAAAVAPHAAPHGAAGRGAGGHGAKDPRPPQEIWAELQQGNAKFADGESSARHPAERRAATAEGQSPGTMVLTCADSRVPPELLFDRDLGELFVVRVAGNIADPAGIGSLEYAADHLGSKVLVVLGHEKCGAVTAALSGQEVPTESLKALVAELEPNLRDVPGTGTAPERVAAGVEANVRATVAEISETSPLLDGKAKKGELLVIPAVYDLASGKVRVLPASGEAPPLAAAGEAPRAAQ